jgi:GTPase SAR1 family protein
MMNDDEVQLEIVQGSTPDPDNRMSIYMIVYSVDSRESFIRAAQILYRLHDSRRLAPGTPVVLVANKIDLQRKRRVTFVGEFFH